MRGRHKNGQRPEQPTQDELAYQRAQELLLMHGPLTETELRSFYHQTLFLVARDGAMTLEGVRATVAGARNETLQRLQREQALNEPPEPGEGGREEFQQTLLQRADARYRVSASDATTEDAATAAPTP
jgi:hypothetical protein